MEPIFPLSSLDCKAGLTDSSPSILILVYACVIVVLYRVVIEVMSRPDFKSLVGPFLCRNFTTLCDQEGGGDPRTFPLLYRVANMWWRQLNFNNISYKITSRPGEVFRFALLNIYFTSFGRSGSQLKGSKFGDSWTVQVYVTGSKVGFNFSCSNDPLTACVEKSQRFL